METFIRKELKYVIVRTQHEKLLELLGKDLMKDPYFESDIYSVYFDTDSFDLMRICEGKPAFRQKIRARSYGPAIHPQDPVFLENKKKNKGICFKNRAAMTLSSLESFLARPEGFDQASREIAYVFGRYPLKAQFALHAHRYSYAWKDRPDLRLTFDDALHYRMHSPGLFETDSDESLLEPGQIILEIKCAASLPLKLSRALFELSIQPASFSKAGQVYQKWIERNFSYEHADHKHLPAARPRLLARSVCLLDL